MDNSEFVTVGKPHKQKIVKISKSFLSYYELVEIIYSKLIIHKNLIVGAFIYGSRARQTNNPDSDADIIVFWRQEYDVEFLKSIRDSIEEALDINIDFVSCVYKKKWIQHNNDNEQAYFENVIIDAKSIIGLESINYLIDRSIKLPKLLH
jgi:predicted nucleotidyltransferase